MVKTTVNVLPNPAKSDLFVPVSETIRKKREPTLGSFFTNTWVRLSGLILLAFLIRFLLLRFNHSLDPDGIWSASLGKELIAGNIRAGLSTYWSPLYPFLIGLSSFVFRDLEFAGRFVSVLAGSLLVVPVYFLCRSLYGNKTAMIAALLVVVHDQLVTSSTALMTEATYLLLFTTAVLCGLMALERGKARLFALTGVAFGACYLVKPEAIGYIGLMLLLTLGTNRFFKKVPSRAVLLSTLLLTTAFLLLALPYIFYIHQQTGEWTISKKFSENLSTSEFNWRRLTPDRQTTKADILWAGVRPTNDGPVLSPASANQLPPAPTNSDHPSRNATGGIRKLASVFGQSVKGLFGEYLLFPQIISPLFLMFAALGLFRAGWSPEHATRQVYLLLFASATLLGYSLTVLQARYLLPLLPLLLCWAANGIVQFEEWGLASLGQACSSRKAFPKHRKLLLPLVVALLILSTLPSLIDFAKTKGQPLEIATWIKEHSDSSPIIMASGPWVAFKTGGTHLYLPNEDYGMVIDYARSKKVKYIVIEEDQIWKTSRLGFLLDEKAQHPELDLVYQYERDRSPRVLVFELKHLPVS